MRQIKNRAPTRCSLHNLVSQASFWVRDSHNNPFHTSIKPVLRVCFYAWKLWPLQTTQTPSSLWKQSSSFCCNSHPTQLRSQGLSICLLDFEPLFLMPDQASEGAKELEASSVEEKSVSPPNPGSRWWERGETVRMLPVKTDFSSLHKKGKLISLNSAFIRKTKPLQKCLPELPEFIPLIRALPYSSPEEVRQKNETELKLQTVWPREKWV